MITKKQLIVGLGEVGNAIYQVLSKHYPAPFLHAMDKLTEKEYQDFLKKSGINSYDYLHIAIPYNVNFVENVKKYQKDLLKEGGITIIHSTVPIGTNDLLNSVASPVRGIHPNLAPGIRTFVKFFGGKDAYSASKIFEGCGIPTRVLANAKDVEALKLWDTTQFGWMILLNKAMKEWCEKNGINFELVYREGNITYNVGYQQLNQPEFVRPFMDFAHGPIGGHCVMENAQILKSGIADFINEINETLKKTGKTGL